MADYFNVSTDYFRIDSNLTTPSALSNSIYEEEFQLSKNEFISRMTTYFVKFSALSESDQHEIMKHIDSKLNSDYKS